jgi:hypothetical protein
MLCIPSVTYLTFSIAAILVVVFQNYYSNRNLLCLGKYECRLDKSDTFYVMSIEFVYAMLSTWIIQTVCNFGFEIIAWFMVLFLVGLNLLSFLVYFVL